MSNPTSSAARPASQWLQSNLAAIGSAAVLTVYAAGFARTKAAADKLNEESDRRRPMARPAQAVGEIVHVDPTPVAANAPASVADARGAVSSTKVADEAAAASTKTKATLVKVDSSVKQVPVALPTPTSGTATVAQTPSSTPTQPVASPSTPSASTPAPSAGAAIAGPPMQAGGIPTVPASSASKSASDTSSGAVAYKDGVYSGWGTSRHGDIQAYVEIKAGKITSAFISECLTQYSCSWITKLPPQVVERQSAEIDYVSGATQSSNALYYAIVDALKKAK